MWLYCLYGERRWFATDYGRRSLVGSCSAFLSWPDNGRPALFFKRMAFSFDGGHS
jgi:hypothetical protein